MAILDSVAYARLRLESYEGLKGLSDRALTFAALADILQLLHDLTHDAGHGRYAAIQGMIDTLADRSGVEDIADAEEGGEGP